MPARIRRSLLLFCLGAAGFFGFFAHGYVENTDGAVTMLAARSLLLRGDLGFGDGPDAWEVERYIVSTRKLVKQGTNGRYYPWFPIGHQLLLVPFVALGEVSHAILPQIEETVTNKVFDGFAWARFFSSFLPALAAAGTALVCLLLALRLGCDGRQALLVTAVATLCTQFWPGASETLSDPPGTFFLLAAFWSAVRQCQQPSRGGAFLVGWLGGCAVLLRYPHAVPVTILATIVFVDAVRRRSVSHASWLVLGALPEVIVLLAANWLRFGSLTETGYSAGATPEWWSYPPYLGIPLILLAPGKGILLFSPPLWIAATQTLRRRARSVWMLAAGLALVLPLVIAGHTAGWAAGQCWSVRYMTASVVLLVVVALALGKPWQRRPRLFVAVCLLGLLVSLGGVLTPYRGQQQLAYTAAPHSHPEHQGAAELENVVVFAPRYSPLHTHWIYAWLSATGRLQRGGSDNTTEPLFGVAVPDAGSPVRVTWPADTGFRHWWIPYAGAFFGLPLWPVAIGWGLLTLALLAYSVRGLLHCRGLAGR